MGWVGILVVGLLSCRAQSQPVALLEYTDLIRLAEAQRGRLGDRLSVQVWDLAGDHRVALAQNAPNSAVLEKIPVAPGCRLRFAIGLAQNSWSQSDGVTFRIHGETSGARPENRQLFEHFLDPGAAFRPGWEDFEVDLETQEETSLNLRFELDPGPSGNPASDNGAWAAPHLVCPTAVGPATAPEHPHVVLISLDTLRPDHLGLYGYDRPTSPRLDRLARESLVFEAAYAPAPWTLPSHASMFTGLYPQEHGAGHATTRTPLGSNVPTLAEILRDAGYRTVGFSAGGLVSRRNGLARGFEVWNERQRVGFRSMLPAIFDQIGVATAAPLFLFLHTYDIHGPYDEWNDPLAPELSNDITVAPEEWQRINKIHYHRYLKLERFEGLGEAIAAYDTGIRTVDGVIGRIIDRLKETGIYGHCILIVTSDHGESLYDRRLYIGHSYQLTDEEIHIPLVAHFPSGQPSGRTKALTSLVDLVPMILEATGVPFHGNLSGSNPLSDWDRPPNGSRVICGEASHSGARYIRTSKWKVIAPARPVGSDESEVPRGLADRFDSAGKIFNVAEDAGENDNLWNVSAALPERARRLQAAAERLPLPGTGEEVQSPLDPETVRSLRALGYLQ